MDFRRITLLHPSSGSLTKLNPFDYNPLKLLIRLCFIIEFAVSYVYLYRTLSTVITLMSKLNITVVNSVIDVNIIFNL